MMNRIELAAARTENAMVETLKATPGAQPVACTPVAIAALAVAAAGTAYYAVRDYNTDSAFEPRDDMHGIELADQASVGQLTGALRAAAAK